MAAAEKDVATEIEQSSEPTLRETLETAFKEAEDRERDESGRFVAKEPKDEPQSEPSPKISQSAPAERSAAIFKKEPEPDALTSTAPAEPKIAGSGGQASEPDIQRAAEPSALAAPASWSYQAKQKWIDLPQEIKAEVSKRELDMTRGMTRMDDERQFARAMGQVVQPYQALIQSQGQNAPAYVGQLLNTVYTLQTGAPHVKAQLWQQLAQQFGIDPQTLAQQPQLDPNIAPIYQEVQQLRTTVQQQQESQRRAQFEAEQRQEQHALSMIEEFGRKPENKYFTSVKAEMGALMNAGIAQSLDQAYDMAINARPDIRAQLQAEEKAKQVAETERQAKAQRAKLKGSSVRGGPGGIQLPPVGERSLRQELEANIAEVTGRL